jgi:outer membrane protein OmpA-like peptidoglycan-associated protein
MSMLRRLVALAAVFAFLTPVLVQASEPSFGKKDPGLMKLKGAIYFLAQDTESMPAGLDSREPEGFIYAGRLDVPTREFTEGFPGVSDRFEWFGLLYKGTFQVSTAGTYAWKLVSDDGSRLWIDGREVIDNDGVHGTLDGSGAIQLAKGPHEIKVWFFQGPATELALQLFVTPPGQGERIFDLTDFSAGLADALGRVKAEATSEGIRVRMDAQVLFDTGKSVLKPAAQSTLADVAKVIASYPGCLVRIDGHTDAQGDDAMNQTLSVARAESVRTALSGMPGLGGPRYEARGFGESRPVAANDTEAGRRQNRRVEITIVPK